MLTLDSVENSERMQTCGDGGDGQGEPNKTFLETLTFTW